MGKKEKKAKARKTKSMRRYLLGAAQKGGKKVIKEQEGQREKQLTLGGKGRSTREGKI